MSSRAETLALGGQILWQAALARRRWPLSGGGASMRPGMSVRLPAAARRAAAPRCRHRAGFAAACRRHLAIGVGPPPEPEPEPKKMADGSWAPDDLIQVERTLMPAGLFSRGFALIIDGVIAGGASAAVGELAMAYDYAPGAGPAIATFGTLMLLRDQLPGQFCSVGKQRMGLELVESDTSTTGLKYGRPTEHVLISPLTVTPLDAPSDRLTRLMRNVHWALLIPLGMTEAVPLYYVIPAVVTGGFVVEFLLVLTTRRSIADFISGTSLVWHDTLGSQKKA